MENFQDSTKEDCFRNSVVKCKNSEAVEAGTCPEKLPITKCQFCGRELEQIGFYLIIGGKRKDWHTDGQYEKCDCEKSINYWIEYDKQKREEKLREESERKKKEYEDKINRLIKGSNLGERFKTRTFETFQANKDNKCAFDTCKSYTEQFSELGKKGIGLSINGNYGTGKTHLAAAITHKLIYQGYQPIFGTLINLLGKIKATYSDPYAKENEDTIVNKYINCDLLIIDDLGKEKPSEWVLEKLYYIINCRYENLKPIIITSNYTNEKLIDRLTTGNNSETPEAIVSRLCEMCQGVDLKDCKDYRKKDLF